MALGEPLIMLTNLKSTAGSWMNCKLVSIPIECHFMDNPLELCCTMPLESTINIWNKSIDYTSGGETTWTNT